MIITFSPLQNQFFLVYFITFLFCLHDYSRQSSADDLVLEVAVIAFFSLRMLSKKLYLIGFYITRQIFRLFDSILPN